MDTDALIFKIKEEVEKKKWLFENNKINRLEVFLTNYEDGFRVDFYNDNEVISQYMLDTYPDYKPEDRKIEEIDIMKNKIISICYHAILSKSKWAYYYWLFILKILYVCPFLSLTTRPFNNSGRFPNNAKLTGESVRQ